MLVTDDPPFPDTPDDAWPLVDVTAWHDAIVEAKDGNEQAIVMIGVLPWGDDLSCVCPWCCPGWGCNAPHVNAIELVESFGEQGVLAGVCADDYSPVLAQTIETIDGPVHDDWEVQSAARAPSAARRSIVGLVARSYP